MIYDYARLCHMLRITLPDTLQPIIDALDRAQITPIIVGGYVRDALLGQPGKDIDIELYGTSTLDTLSPILDSFGPLNAVGKSFGVLKLQHAGLEIDFALPRTESKTGAGHKGFHVKHSGDMSFEEAASRRDFTINSMGWNPTTQTLLDPYNGQEDLKNRRLRHVSDAFSEDPLRVLRGVQFAARFDCTMDTETQALCQQQDLSELPKERLLDEWAKLLLKARKPSVGLTLMKDLGLLKYYPELAALIGCEQDPEWHPEGDVWVHTLMVVDEMAALRTGDPKRDLLLMLSALCHDLGKPDTTVFQDGRWRSPNHEAEGVPPTKQFLARLTDEKALVKAICDIVREHLKPALLYNDNQRGTVSDAAIRRLSLRVNLQDLYLVTQADHYGRTTPDAIAKDFPAGIWLMERAAALEIKDQKPQPILKGRHLIPLGIKPGKGMGPILKAAFEAQLDGAFSTEEEALSWVQTHINR